MAIVGSIDQLKFRDNVYEIVPEIAPLFQETVSYNSDDWVIYEAGLYKFKANKSAGAWDATKVDGPFKVTNLISELKSGFNGLYNSAYVTDSASGGIAHFEDGSDNVPMKSLKINIEPVQSGSGDPSPSNVRPISGFNSVKVTRAGKNLLDISFNRDYTISGITFTNNGDGSITVNGTATDAVNYTFAKTTKSGLIERGFLSLVGKTVSVSGCPSGGGPTTYRLQAARFGTVVGSGSKFVDEEGSGVLYTIKDFSEETSGIYIRIHIESGTVCNNLIFKPMITLVDEDDTYEPYNGNTYDISLSSAGTVYGGTLDVVSGELTVDRKGVPMETLTWSRITSYANPIFNSNVSDKAVSYKKTLCSVLHNLDAPNVISAQGFANRANDGDYACSNGNAQIYARLDSATTVQGFVTAVTGQTIVYPLATPITYNLTPTEVKSLLGINNVWSDAGDVDVEYRADTKLYIDKRLAEVTS